jgi:hypothetical protein
MRRKEGRVTEFVNPWATTKVIGRPVGGWADGTTMPASSTPPSETTVTRCVPAGIRLLRGTSAILSPTSTAPSKVRRRQRSPSVP